MISISNDAVKEIKDHSDQMKPNEACGILTGPPMEKTITTVHRCTNIDPHPFSAYNIEPSELLNILTSIEDQSETTELLGFYHSHPFSSPYPSFTDVMRASWDGYIYLIYSLPEDKIKCWRWDEVKGDFYDEKIICL